MKLFLTPISRAEAQHFIKQHHRHHGAPVGDVFRMAVSCENGIVRGVATVGRPVARMLDDGWTLEVNRCCTDGSRNACSMLYGAAWRAAQALGYRKLITYTLATEFGASLRASGWRVIGEVRGRSWNRESRPRVDTHPLQDKLRWEAPQHEEGR